MTYSADFRKLALDKLATGMKIKQVAAEMNIDVSTIYKWQSHQPVSKDKRKPFFHKIDPELLKQDVEQYPDDYQSERAARFGCCLQRIGQMLKQLKLSRKKNAKTPKSR